MRCLSPPAVPPATCRRGLFAVAVSPKGWCREVFSADAASDIRVFTSRVQRLDPAALIRMSPAADSVSLWSVLPFRVLANLTVTGGIDSDTTVRATDLLLTLPRLPRMRVDEQWRGSLPSSAGFVVEELTTQQCRQLGAAAASTLESARGKGVGDRRLRDALLDHVAVEVSARGVHHEIRMRLIIGLLRMGFASADAAVRVRVSGTRLGLETTTGAVWDPATGLSLS